MAEYLLPLSGYIVCNFDHAVIAVFEELTAFRRYIVRLCAEIRRDLALGQRVERRGIYVAHAPFVQHVKVARIYTAVAFYQIIRAAAPLHCAGFGYLAEEYAYVVVKCAHRHVFALHERLVI